jgi:2-polyprenyl-3-methyl-5-hydroxy-6-metoxy-1,4-benzoquinol methylase
MDWYADFVCERFNMFPQSVLDIGCNDGSQLDKFKARGLETYGVDQQ